MLAAMPNATMRTCMTTVHSACLTCHLAPMLCLLYSSHAWVLHVIRQEGIEEVQKITLYTLMGKCVMRKLIIEHRTSYSLYIFLEVKEISIALKYK